MTSHSARLAVVTVTYNSGRYLQDFLESTTLASTSPVQVVVADNDSGEAAQLRATAERHGATFVPTGGNRGYGAAVNRAVAELSQDVRWILVCNPDVGLGESSLDALVAAGRSDDRIGAVGPLVLETDGSVYPSARRVPSLRTGIGHALLAGAWPTNPWTRAYHADGEHSARRDAGWLSGACVLVRREAFEALGGFDEGFFMYFEDVDLGHRLGRAGWRNVYEPAAHVLHVGAHSTTTSGDAMRLAHHRSAYRFLARKYDSWYLLPLRVALRVALSLRSRLGRRP